MWGHFLTTVVTVVESFISTFVNLDASHNFADKITVVLMLKTEVIDFIFFDRFFSFRTK